MSVYCVFHLLFRNISKLLMHCFSVFDFDYYAQIGYDFCSEYYKSLSP